MCSVYHIIDNELNNILELAISFADLNKYFDKEEDTVLLHAQTKANIYFILILMQYYRITIWAENPTDYMTLLGGFQLWCVKLTHVGFNNKLCGCFSILYQHTHNP